VKRRQSNRVVVVGSGWRFTSGLSYYTCHLANALSTQFPTSVILMRQLIPTLLYPGSSRVGTVEPDLQYDRRVVQMGDVDWWGRGLLSAAWRIGRERPHTMLFEWWTGAVAHSYLLLALVSRASGSRVYIEFHELQDTGEAALPLVAKYTKFMLRQLINVASGFLMHSTHDEALIRSTMPIGMKPTKVVLHGPFDHHLQVGTQEPACVPVKQADVYRILYFGTVRPYKGVEHLIEAFNMLDRTGAEVYELAIIGETWERWHRPDKLIERSPYRSSIYRVDRYVPDAEVAAWFASADLLVLPYLRSSASGPMHIGMAWGLPIIVSDVEALHEASAGYPGVWYVEPGDIAALRDAIVEVRRLPRNTYVDPRSWMDTVSAMGELFRR
jgi:glycosyltransferase involved in cell wall biosynthesis